ncbi:chromate transporter [Metabacillus bambusae]|uniref:Chromate transporter n=1 Tax=Metabacillus bambusae TaxID=2795218 RepID=A0ABS3N752_9BACI|nr:chromate transporter [Metabacillus bambusae]MBO1514077.1 chromate transporter [Metabacillus bambusae]
MILFELFWVFLLIGFVSFGGGYAMIPVIEMEVINKGWMTTQQFTDVIAIAGMSPGPIATNSAIFVGYQVNGITGAIAAGLGMVIPSLLLVIIIATFFYRISKNKHVESAFYGLRPIITGLIGYAAIKFAISNHLLDSFSWYSGSLLAIFALSLFSLIKLRLHPALVIVMSGVLGAAIYS